MRRGASLALLVTAALACSAWGLLRGGLLCPVANWALDRALEGRTPLKVHIGSFGGDAFHGIDAGRITVLAPVQGAMLPLLSLDRLEVRYDLWPLLKGPQAWKRVPRLVHLEGLRLWVLRDPGGVWNLSAFSAGGSGPVRKRTTVFHLPIFRALPACRVELENSSVAFQDDLRGFRTTVDQVQASVDARSAPNVSFSLSGRTGGLQSRNLALSGVWDVSAGAADARLDLRGVPLAAYLDYFLVPGGPRFIAGNASLDVRLGLRRGRPLAAAGSALLSGGELRLPGIRAPLSGLNGRLDFGADSLRLVSGRARFLGSNWDASGSLTHWSDPQADLRVSNGAVPLAALSRQVIGLNPLALSGTASVSASLKGPLIHPRVEVVLIAPSLTLKGVEFNTLSAHAVWLGRHLKVDHVEAALWGGQVQGNVALEFGHPGALAADLSVTGALLQLGSVDGRPLPFSGLADFQARFSGPLRRSRAQFRLDVNRLRLGPLPWGDARMDANLIPGSLRGTLASSDGRLKGKLGLSWAKKSAVLFQDTSLSLEDVPLSATALALASWGSSRPGSAARAHFWTDLSGRLGGAWSASFTAQGPVKSPSLRAELRLADGRLALGAARSEGLPLWWKGRLDYASGALSFGNAALPFAVHLGPLKKGLNVTALGNYRFSGRSQSGDALRLRFGADLGFLDGFGFARGDRGWLSAALTVTGGAADPRSSGILTVTGFSCLPLAHLAAVRDGALRVLFQGSTLSLDTLSFRAPGLVRASGDFDFSGGLAAVQGRIRVSTDQLGLGLRNWPSLGTGNLVLDPLELGFGGVGAPARIAGRVVLHDAHITYAGAAPTDSAGAPARLPPLDIDLRVGLGPNVWYDKRQSKALDLSDPAHWFSDTLESAQKSLIDPDLSLRFAPTTKDLVIRDSGNGMNFSGELTVDRGWVTVMQNDFQLGGAQGPTLIRLHGGGADVSGTAAVNLSYTRSDPLTGRPIQNAVKVMAELSPRSEAERDALGLEGHFLNYRLRFDSDPLIIQGNPQLQQTAVLDLVLLGDPVVDVGAGNNGTLSGPGGPSGIQQSADPAALLASASLGAVTTGFARKELSGLLGGLDIPGYSWLDVARLNPRIRYQMVGASPISAPGGAATAQPLVSPAQSSYDLDWSLELGKNFGQNIYTSLQAMTFGQNDRDSVIVASQSDQAVLSYGLRGGFEYRLGPYRDLDVYEDFGCDDNLNPVAYPSRWAAPDASVLVQLRATVPTGNYGTLLARRRRFDGQGVQP